jgi:serine/threonine protein phosphatase PrpC
MQAVLWGKDHVALDEVVAQSLGPRAAVAITRGRHRKAYRYTDPNEDAVVAVVGRRATLLVAADGHNGWTSTEAAVASVLDTLGADPPPADLDDDELLEVFSRANDAILDVTEQPGSQHPDSRTTLVVALVAGSRLQWASFGDSAVYKAAPAGAVRLSGGVHYFVGYPMPREGLDRGLKRGTEQLSEGDWVIVATDGFIDFAHPFPTQLLAAGAEAEAVARGLVLAACDGGAGDNVAVAVVGP